MRGSSGSSRDNRRAQNLVSPAPADTPAPVPSEGALERLDYALTPLGVLFARDRRIYRIGDIVPSIARVMSLLRDSLSFRHHTEDTHDMMLYFAGLTPSSSSSTS
jgi:hypothetical protein